MNNTRSPEQRTENQIRLGVEIPLNLFNRQQYGIKIAQSKARAVSTPTELLSTAESSGY